MVRSLFASGALAVAGMAGYLAWDVTGVPAATAVVDTPPARITAAAVTHDPGMSRPAPPPPPPRLVVEAIAPVDPPSEPAAWDIPDVEPPPAEPPPVEELVADESGVIHSEPYIRNITVDRHFEQPLTAMEPTDEPMSFIGCGGVSQNNVYIVEGIDVEGLTFD